MNEYINLDADNIDSEHICCAIGDPKHQNGVDRKKEWIRNKFRDGHVFRKLNARGKIFIEYEPLDTAWVPVKGNNYMYIYCLWVAGSFKGKGIGRELLEYAVKDARERKMSGICTLVSRKKKPFIGDRKFFEYFGFKEVDSIDDYQLMALSFDDGETPVFSESARKMEIDSQDFTIFYSNIFIICGLLCFCSCIWCTFLNEIYKFIFIRIIYINIFFLLTKHFYYHY